MNDQLQPVLVEETQEDRGLNDRERTKAVLGYFQRVCYRNPVKVLDTTDLPPQAKQSILEIDSSSSHKKWKESILRQWSTLTSEDLKNIFIHK